MSGTYHNAFGTACISAWRNAPRSAAAVVSVGRERQPNEQQGLEQRPEVRPVVDEPRMRLLRRVFPTGLVHENLGIGEAEPGRFTQQLDGLDLSALFNSPNDVGGEGVFGNPVSFRFHFSSHVPKFQQRPEEYRGMAGSHAEPGLKSGHPLTVYARRAFTAARIEPV